MMRVLFQIELEDVDPSTTTRSVLEVGRDAHNNVTFTIIDGAFGKPSLTGQCDPAELVHMAHILGDSND